MEIIDYTVVIIYLVFIMGFGVFLQKKASTGIESYFLGNRNLPWWVLGASGMASNTDLAGTMILTALVYALGTKGFFIEIRGGIVLYLACLMTFIGKWNRRAQVMTVAEWMQLRFGMGREGNIARIISAVANIIFAIASISYFAVGGGKFLGIFLEIDDRVAGVLLILLALIYTAISGFYGVVLTDVFQGILIFVAVLYICFMAFKTVNLPETFSISIPGTEQLKTWNLAEWSSLTPPITIDLPGDYSIFNLFGGVMLFYTFKVFLEGAAGGGGYVAQRYFAAKSDREAGLLSLFWIFLLSFRWPLVTAFAVLGIDYGLKNQVISDPELVLPTVIAEYIPVGIKGLLIACFIAAAMSTFDSIINSSAAYWVKDIYQAYLKPEASNQQLVNQGRLASIVIVGLGLMFSFNITNINDIWGWLTLGLGTGLFIPLVLRWYWWRFNGYGFAIGTGAGLVAAILTKAVILPVANNSQAQEYILFLVPSICSFLGCILGTFFTPATNLETIDNFYRVTRPFGFWEVVRKKLPTNIQAKIQAENKRDIMATFIAIPWQLVLFLMGMMLMMKQWDNFGILLLIFILLSIGLYFTWFKYLEKI
ncbi:MULTISPECIES: sodium:solute symporter [Okeania]|uniref:Sodium:solute symporter n=1 Tax=Okeania hirsuta TaxID=1458930 RepID=A0A3N6Q2E4_9CYAN|nr:MULTISPECIES: sodium:solute symporter [Okeania]NET16345.1 sodium:solute symporter [Okeania sp. SIO1H6]NES77404.1 sodium:solute symporter [Okeania sp. SIO1H4]NES89622.1 sodium:solute symporter [Okeania sp. SIO2B9]NET21017.1 sodium:solute symporter [Okeania sp. SIO1H5]NET77193.1 sodium:solute symporter [Okeania sp. SIO1F9]